jgi:hypothetical protein
MAKEIFMTIGVDIDAVAGWIGSYGGGESSSDIQLGVWAGAETSSRSTRAPGTNGPGSITRKRPEEWMKPLVHGKQTDLVEISPNWYVDDLPPMLFMKAAPNSHGLVSPHDIEKLWRDQFD